MKSDDLLVRVVKEGFQEGSVDDRTLLGREGMPLVFDPRAKVRTRAEFLEWHRQSYEIETLRMSENRPHLIHELDP